MADELRQYVDTRLAQLRAEHKLTTGVEPLRCLYGDQGLEVGRPEPT
ncbi:MAG: hypothetical protein ACRDUX_28230 [Mycobacterium sp.]